MAWQAQCLGCEAREQEVRNISPKAKGVKVFLRRAWSITRDELDRLGA